MSEIIEAVQKQDPGSEVVYLYVLEYADGSFAYFTPYNDDSAIPASIEFRDAESPHTARTYLPMPIMSEGFDVSSDGSYSRPTLTVANTSSSFSDEIGNIEYDDLLGRRITRRMTLRKYLVGESGDATPPVEYPNVTYILDRIQERNVISVTFELSAPFDLAGVTLPRRQIIGGACPWQYQGASPDLPPHKKRGGCNWNRFSRHTIDGVTDFVFVNSKDEYVVSDAINFTAFSGSATAGGYYSTTKSGLTEIEADGSLTTGVSVTEYWQCLSDTSTTPSAVSAEWRQLRVYSSYGSTGTYKAYTDPSFNEYVLHTISGDPHPSLWQVASIGLSNSIAHPAAPGPNKYWNKGDSCAKRLSSCSKRFHATVDSSGGPGLDTRKAVPLPFGGFPGSRRFR